MDIEQRMQKLRNGSDTARWAAAEIDRLRNELRHANSTVDQMQEILDDYEDAHPAVKAERDEALAKLAAMESQDPVASVKSINRHGDIDIVAVDDTLRVGDSLYAKPVPADKTAVPDKLTYSADDYPKEERTQMHGYINGWNNCIDAILAAAPSHSQQSADQLDGKYENVCVKCERIFIGAKFDRECDACPDPCQSNEIKGE